jgi:hypothetical protein
MTQGSNCTCLFQSLLSSDLISENVVVFHHRHCLHDLLAVDATVDWDITANEFLPESDHWR